ncbi:MAG: hypothetical protein ACE5D8_05530 [Fidelibacterota bacterium]
MMAETATRSLVPLVQAALFSAVAIGGGFGLVFIPNIEVISVIVFLSGVTLGVRWGFIVGVVSETVFSVMNPLGSGLLFPPLLVAQITGFAIIGITGGLTRRLFWHTGFSPSRRLQAGVFGVLLTFVYDTLTTLSYPVSVGMDWQSTTGVYLTGMALVFIHILSNFFVFSLAVPLVIPPLVHRYV